MTAQNLLYDVTIHSWDYKGTSQVLGRYYDEVDLCYQSCLPETAAELAKHLANAEYPPLEVWQDCTYKGKRITDILGSVGEDGTGKIIIITRS
jgi:hypothetical protein